MTHEPIDLSYETACVVFVEALRDDGVTLVHGCSGYGHEDVDVFLDDALKVIESAALCEHMPKGYCESRGQEASDYHNTNNCPMYEGGGCDPRQALIDALKEGE